MFLKNTYKNRFNHLISSINSIKEEPLSSKANVKKPPVKCNQIHFGDTSELKVSLLPIERKSNVSCTVVPKVL